MKFSNVIKFSPTDNKISSIIREIRDKGVRNNLGFEDAKKLEKQYERMIERYEKTNGKDNRFGDSIIEFPETTMEVLRLNLGDLIGMRSHYSKEKKKAEFHFDTGLVYSLRWDSQALEIVSREGQEIRSHSYKGSFCARMSHEETHLFKKSEEGFGPRKGLLKSGGGIYRW